MLFDLEKVLPIRFMIISLLLTGDVAITFVHNNGNHDTCMVE